MNPASVRPATPADIHAIRALLLAAALPVEDLDRAQIQFWVAEEGRPVLGAIGLERRGSSGLLRSLVVAPSHQNYGVGRALVATLERDARDAGVDDLVLLTQTAEKFFRAAGYAVVERSEVPESLRALEEFRSLCPASAVCLRKSLRGAQLP